MFKLLKIFKRILFSVLWGSQKGSAEHLFLKFSFVRSIWQSILEKLKIKEWPSDFSALWTTWRSENVPKFIKIEWDLSAMAIVWMIWCEKNIRIFSGKYRTGS